MPEFDENNYRRLSLPARHPIQTMHSNKLTENIKIDMINI